MKNKVKHVRKTHGACCDLCVRGTRDNFMKEWGDCPGPFPCKYVRARMRASAKVPMLCPDNAECACGGFARISDEALAERMMISVEQLVLELL